MSPQRSRIRPCPRRGRAHRLGLLAQSPHPRRDAMTSLDPQTASQSATMQTVLVTWTEVSQHQARVQVPLGADIDELDLENRLAELDDDGFQGLEREINSVTEVEHDPHAEILVPADPTTERRVRIRH